MFSVEKIENGFLLKHGDSETFFKNERALITGVRTALGMKRVGRPKKVVDKRPDWQV